MPKRPYDSSLTRVVPVFDALQARDPMGQTWLTKLLGLPRHGHPEAQIPPVRLSLTSAHWGSAEKPLQPPVSLLSWLIRCLPVEPRPESVPSEATQRRRALSKRDPATIEEGLATAPLGSVTA